MFKRDIKGKFTYRDIGLFTKQRLYRFHSGKIHTKAEWQEDDYRTLIEKQKREPVALMQDLSTKKKWWMFMNEFYYEDEDYSPINIKILVLDLIDKRNKKIQEARTRLAARENKDAISRETSNHIPRERIPDKVKLYVWQRDGGRCAKCGSQEKLEYDHIIPISKGGGNTERNIQLLCEKCNRTKGANLF